MATLVTPASSCANQWIHATIYVTVTRRRRITGDTPGERLRAARLAAKLSQPELSRRTGIDRAQLSAYENVRRQMGADNAEKIAAALAAEGVEVSPEDLTDWTGLSSPEVRWRREIEERLDVAERKNEQLQAEIRRLEAQLRRRGGSTR